MNARYTKLLVLIITIIILYKTFHYFQLTEDGNIEEEIEDIGKVTVSVHYEALCPDSKFFISHQLLPTYRDLTKFISLDLIPYGKAQTIENDNEIEFHCQHDAIECFANKIHACVIEKINEPLVQLEYITCMIKDNHIPDEAGEKCGRSLNLDYSPISECASNAEGSKLLKKHGERTNSLNPPVKFIPTIELNGSQNLVSQPQILKDLKSALCTVLNYKPSKCS
ncbi:GILT-like protein 1 [Diorhabda carinulata]|uniref:GILT-like protein 1 n=1 Tax=Diorhabda carinulata TaxID=1163345 RepID=UPI0025A00629|nr:GILT-like protein 1 [Diorhabda carinulata]